MDIRRCVASVDLGLSNFPGNSSDTYGVNDTNLMEMLYSCFSSDKSQHTAENVIDVSKYIYVSFGLALGPVSLMTLIGMSLINSTNHKWCLHWLYLECF